MSYLSAIRKRNEVVVWERDKYGRQIKTYPAPFYFFKKDPNGEYVSIFGDTLTKCEFTDAEEYEHAVNVYKGKGEELFESDVLPEQRILSAYYYNIEPPPLNVSFLDIEVDYDPMRGFSSTNEAYAPINSIAFYHQWLNKYVLLTVPPHKVTRYQLEDEMNNIDPLPSDANLEIEICQNELELLSYLIDEIHDSDVLSGWNSALFDLPYIAKRLENIGPKYFKRLSFPNAFSPKYSTVKIMGKENLKVVLSGRVSLDYLDLFKKYEVSERPSYKLESIADEVLPNMPKLQYEGSLAKLYQSNFPYFIRYNLRDTEILKGFEEKLNYVAIANTMAHISTCSFNDVLGTIKLSEMAINNYCWHELNMRIPNRHVHEITSEEDESKIQGAFVLDPKAGMHEWIGSVDINSLYPSAIRSINISPETLIGQFKETENAVRLIQKDSDTAITLEFDDKEQEDFTLPALKWKQILRKSKWAISGYGTVFDQNKNGIIPAVLESWYDTRKQYQQMKRAAPDKLQEAHYDRLQFIYKIKLNSLYGALSNKFFRYFDPRMGESTTGTGRMILQHQCCKVGKLLTDEYDINSDAIIYGDTDSSYFKTYASTKEEAIKIADAVATKVNKSYQQFMTDTFLCQPNYNNFIRCGREVVADRGIFVKKKRYILHVIDNEGQPVDKLKIMGLELKKTILPKSIQKTLTGFIEQLLKGVPWSEVARNIIEYKDEIIRNKDVQTIGLPKGIQGIEKYTDNYFQAHDWNLPGHIAAAICYNKCLEEFNDKESVKITSGMKIRVIYLTNTLFTRFTSIAIPTDIEIIPDWFYSNCVIDNDKHLAKLIDNPLKNIITAIGHVPPDRDERIFHDVVGGNVKYQAHKQNKKKNNVQTQNKTELFGVKEENKKIDTSREERAEKERIQKRKQGKIVNDILGI